MVENSVGALSSDRCTFRISQNEVGDHFEVLKGNLFYLTLYKLSIQTLLLLFLHLKRHSFFFIYSVLSFFSFYKGNCNRLLCCFKTRQIVEIE